MKREHLAGCPSGAVPAWRNHREVADDTAVPGRGAGPWAFAPDALGYGAGGADPELTGFDFSEFNREKSERTNLDEGGDSGRADAPFDWAKIWSPCERRLRAWRVPPRWSARDWIEEMRSEAVAVALVALADFRPERNVPLVVYLRMRIMGQVLSCYRKEWSYALRQAPDRPAHEPWEVAEPDREVLMREELTRALGVLRDDDRWLLDRLYRRDETEGEVARALGLSQQAVNKRKQSILKTLRHQMGAAN